MNSYSVIKDDIIQINSEFLKLLDAAGEYHGNNISSLMKWETSLKTISSNIEQDIVRVASVGSIKSGKSTFTNCLLKGDYLKRGAGVVTSIVTRVVGGQNLKATLYFKRLHEINDEISQALTLFPDQTGLFLDRGIDITRDSDREKIKVALSNLSPDMLISHDTRNLNSVLLSSYLKGYERVKDMISSDETIISFEKENFGKHHEYVSSDALSVYLKDLRLEIVNEDLGPHLELADCQGSDSPNPMHVAMIQDYLVSAHFIIYVISSRTGVRQADIRFLSMIKKMGFSDNILFVLNCDFSEHDDLANLNSISEKVREDLLLLINDPVIFRFSSLYHLFNGVGDQLSRKDRARFEQWCDEDAFTKDSASNFEMFQNALSLKVNKGRFSLLIDNYMSRLETTLLAFENWINLNQNLINRNAIEAREIIGKIEYHSTHIHQLKEMIQSTLKGAALKVKEQAKYTVDKFLDPKSSVVIQKLESYIRHYHANLQENENLPADSRFTNKLYYVFQDFKLNVDRYITENINPEITSFIKNEEKRLLEDLMQVSEPFEVMIGEAIDKYEKTLSEIGFDWERGKTKGSSINIEEGKNGFELMLPKAHGLLNYNAVVKTDAIMRLGVYTCVGWMKKVMKKTVENKEIHTTEALKDAVRRMKNDAMDAIVSHFLDYKENIKFQYMTKMTDAYVKKISEHLSVRFESYATDLTYMLTQLDQKTADKEKIKALNAHIKERVTSIRGRLENTRQTLEASVMKKVF